MSDSLRRVDGMRASRRERTARAREAGRSNECRAQFAHLSRTFRAPSALDLVTITNIYAGIFYAARAHSNEKRRDANTQKNSNFANNFMLQALFH